MNLVNREFKLWDFRVSHNQLLLRSPKTETPQMNIDILFVGVYYLDLPTFVPEPVISVPETSDFLKAQEALGRDVKKEELFVIKIGERRHIVVAVAMKIFENDLDLFESSLESFRIEVDFS